MRKSLAPLITGICMLWCVASPARGWIGTLGVGATFSPGAFLLNPQLEYVVKPWLLFGPNMQLALGNGTLFAGSAAVRFPLGGGRIKPTIEGGLGIAVASGYGSNVGFLIHFGMGFDYWLSRGIALGTTFRANFMPGLKDFMLSWPVLQLRFTI